MLGEGGKKTLSESNPIGKIAGKFDSNTHGQTNGYPGEKRNFFQLLLVEETTKRSFQIGLAINLKAPSKEKDKKLNQDKLYVIYVSIPQSSQLIFNSLP